MKKYKFKAKIEAGDGGGAYVLFPYDTGKEFATNGKVPVKATFEGVPYTGSLIKYGHPLHSLGMPKGIREQIGRGPGDTIEVIVWKDEELRTVEVPLFFGSILSVISNFHNSDERFCGGDWTRDEINNHCWRFDL